MSGLPVSGLSTSELPVRRSARLVIIDDQQRLLLFRYHDEHQAPFWATAGGELLPGEDYRDAAQRELQEETGFDAGIGPLLRERNDIYAVARSQPARWLEQYFLVRCKAPGALDRRGWTEEERATIRHWQWWTLAGMRAAPAGSFRPEWLPALMEQALAHVR